ncbi:MAG: glycoside hydrolase family 2 TIM barrel-domain containing protein, partial [Bacteroidota bacterium]|nr:glycoside hydrolase family 2 TIM barrel-domain containing protein [Bacteroidota bacterium]
MNTFLKKWGLCFALLSFSFITTMGANGERNTTNFNKGWKFNLGDVPEAKNPGFDDSNWRTLNLPHDWSIEGEFSEKNPAGTGGGALPGGIGWYRKEFTVSPSEKGKSVSIDFDGVYRNCEVWINGHYLGIRPYGYSSFRYNLTPYLLYGKKNVIAVKVDNSVQPNSRWYSGSGIYRNVWLVYTNKVAVAHWGTYITTPEIKTDLARVHIITKLNSGSAINQPVVLKTSVYNKEGQLVGSASSRVILSKKTGAEISQNLSIKDPVLWSVDRPYLYKAVSQVQCGGKLSDEYETSFGIRHFTFDQQRGFLLNGQQVKIKGVCDHHDLGCLGAAINTRALERQLEILKAMGCNGIRTSHNPPAPELLDLCDRMGFVVMDEAFDMWKKQKTKYDYHLDWDKWHKRDLEDMILRDRNHPSIVLWSIGNEIPEQGSLAGDTIARELASIVKKLDDRPITSACNHVSVDNHIIRSGALDVVGTNYFQKRYPDFPAMFPGKPYVASETTSALATRGSYDMPSELIRRWPVREKGVSSKMNPDLTCSAYDNC